MRMACNETKEHQQNSIPESEVASGHSGNAAMVILMCIQGSQAHWTLQPRIAGDYICLSMKVDMT